MPGFPADLYNRCRKIFLKCPQFESLGSLRSLFIVDDLYPFRDGLRNADTSGLLVDKNLEYFVEQKLKDGRSVLHIILKILIERSIDGTEVREELLQIYKDLQIDITKVQSNETTDIQIRNSLIDNLFRFDFNAQIKAFRKIIESHDVAAFLIHGPPEFGQRTLTNRLSHLLPKWNNGIYIPIEATANGIGRRSDTLWRDLARRLKMPSNTAPRELAKKVLEWKESQDVIIVIHTVDYIPLPTLYSCLEDFWKIIFLASQGKEETIPPKTHLILFLVDYDGNVCKEAKDLQMFIETPDTVNLSYLPLVLPVNQEFPEDLLDNWFDSVLEFLPVRPNIKEILNETKGAPDRVFEKIYSICEVCWEGEIII